MSLQRTKLTNIQTVTGVSTVGIFTVGVNHTPVGIASTTYIRSAVFHNIGINTCNASMFVYPNTNPVSGDANDSYRILSVDLNPTETFLYEMSYPIVLTGSDAIAIEVNSTGNYSGIGSEVNVLLLGDTDISSEV